MFFVFCFSVRRRIVAFLFSTRQTRRNINRCKTGRTPLVIIIVVIIYYNRFPTQIMIIAKITRVFLNVSFANSTAPGARHV